MQLITTSERKQNCPFASRLLSNIVIRESPSPGILLSLGLSECWSWRAVLSGGVMFGPGAPPRPRAPPLWPCGPLKLGPASTSPDGRRGNSQEQLEEACVYSALFNEEREGLSLAWISPKKRHPERKKNERRGKKRGCSRCCSTSDRDNGS